MTREEVLAAGKNRRIVHTRRLLSAARIDISVNVVSKSVARGRTLAKRYDQSLT